MMHVAVFRNSFDANWSCDFLVANNKKPQASEQSYQWVPMKYLQAFPWSNNEKSNKCSSDHLV